MRKIQFQNEYYYHIYNRGVDKRDIFMDEDDYLRFLESIREFNTEEIIDSLYRLKQLRSKESVDIGCLHRHPMSTDSSRLIDMVCYCLNPNHYHLILKQKQENGISKFMHKISMGYSKYFNNRYDRSGSLFQGKFKAVKVDSDDQLIYLSAYINANSEIHSIKKAEKWKWSSYSDYVGIKDNKLCNKDIILKQFKNINDYQEYLEGVIKNAKQIKEDKRSLILES